MALDDTDIERIATRVAELLLPHLAPTTTTGTTATANTDTLTDAAHRLKTWITTHTPHWATTLGNTTDHWCNTIAHLAGTTPAEHALAWALSPTCPTPHWATTYSTRPIPAPTTSTRGTPRYGAATQLLAEYRLTTTDPTINLADVDHLITACTSRAHTLNAHPTTPGPRTRKNAIDILRATHADPTHALAIIDWCTTTRTHWRTNFHGVPTAKTFRAMRADWHHDGGDFTLETLDAPTATTIDELAHGWTYFIATATGTTTPPPSPHTLHRIHTTLTGTDGGHPIAADDIKQIIKWICAPGHGRTRYYADGPHFPRPDRIRKALIDMHTTTDHTSVTGTNTAAADHTTNTADDELRNTL